MSSKPLISTALAVNAADAMSELCPVFQQNALTVTDPAAVPVSTLNSRTVVSLSIQETVAAMPDERHAEQDASAGDTKKLSDIEPAPDRDVSSKPLISTALAVNAADAVSELCPVFEHDTDTVTDPAAVPVSTLNSRTVVSLSIQETVAAMPDDAR